MLPYMLTAGGSMGFFGAEGNSGPEATYSNVKVMGVAFCGICASIEMNTEHNSRVIKSFFFIIVRFQGDTYCKCTIIIRNGLFFID